MKIKYGIMADCHGNLPALKKIHQTFIENGCQKIFHIGDSIIKGPSSNECVRFLKDHNIICTVGNHEENYLKYRAGEFPHDFLDTKPHTKWTYESIDNISYDFIKNMKKHTSENVNGLNLVFTHYGFNTVGKIIRSINIDTYKDHVEETFKQFLPADIIFFAHTHERLFCDVNETTYINPGSVGAIKDGYAKGLILSIEDNGNFLIDFLDISCDKNELKELFLNKDIPDKELLMKKFFNIKM